MDNFNYFGQGDIPVIPAPDRIQQLEAILQQVSAELSQKDRTVASYGAAVTEANMRIFGLNLTVADYRRRVGMLERNNNAHRAVNLDLGRKLGDRDRAVSAQASAIYGLTNQLNGRDQTIGECRSSIASYEQTTVSQALEVIDLGNKLNERDSTIADLQRTVTELQHANANHVHTINGLQRTVADLQHANAGHVQTINELERANANQQSQLNEAYCTSAICLGGINYLMNRYTENEYGTEIHRQSLDAAIPPQDIPTDDDDSDVTDMVVDIPTSADTVATTPVIASPVIDPQPGLPLPSFDLTDTARHESLGVIYDQYGVEVTPERLLAAIKPFVFIDFDLLLAIYYSRYGCRLLPSDAIPLDFIQACTGRGTLRRWTPQPTGAHSARLMGVNLLCRCELELDMLRLNILKRLGLEEDNETVVLGPVLCYVLVTLCGIGIDQMTGHILDTVFTTVTGVKLQLLRVATEGGTNQMSEDDICHMVKAWVEGLGEFIANDDDIEHLFDLARLCNGKYERRCAAEGYDSMGNIAAEMLERNEYFSQLFLGLQKADLEKVYTVLVHVFNSRASQETKRYLRQVSLELQRRPHAP
ncbi:hypothetical protein GGI24_003591 [Coemansia furcata]|nr:hypothetical protein GGI24_003591 [Coemansia furcata]